MALREDQIRRYARHILLPEVGGRGQERLLGGAVAIDLAAGPAAVAAAAYLAAAGVGRLIVASADAALEADEIATGILYGAADLGRARLDALRARVAALNPDVTVTAGAPSAADVALAPAPAVTVADALVSGGQAAAVAIAALLGRAAPLAGSRGRA